MLNESQRAAVERWGQDVCVVAGPGSGKTRVLIERFRWLVQQKSISARRILAVTFTEKAATEIKKRLIDTFAESAPLREEIERAWVSTIHGFCTRLLKENAIAAGIDPEFRLLDEAESQIALRRLAGLALDGLLAEHLESMRVLLYELDTGASDIADGIIDLYEELRSAGVPIGDLRPPQGCVAAPWDAVTSAARVLLTDPPNGNYKQREAHIKLHHWAREVQQAQGSWQDRVAMLERMPKPSSLKIGTRARSLAQELRDSTIPAVQGELLLGVREPLYPIVIEAVQRMHREYAAFKRANGCLDFDDLQEQAIHLLETNHELRQRVAASFDQILMDELQDTNRLQWRLIDLIRRPGSLFAVGDINQSIYYFRHADPSVFRDYRDSLAARNEAVDELRENYRSRVEVLNVINAVTPYLLGGVEPHRLVARRESPPKTAPSVEFVQTFNARPDSEPVQLEARWIARRIRELNPARYSQVAILARTIASLTFIQEALDEFGIPSVTTGGRGFFEAREVRDLQALLAVLANPRDEISLALVLRSPLVGASDEALLRLRSNPDLPAALDELIANIDSPGVDSERLHWFWTLVNNLRRRIDNLPPDQLITPFLDEAGYQQGLPARARANIAKFLALLRQRHGRQPVPLAQLADDIDQRRQTHSEPEAAAAEITNSVRLMSIHAAKGLEFPIVFIAAMRNGGQNRKPILCFDCQHFLGASWRHPSPIPNQAKGISDSVHLRVMANRKRQESSEEDRLLYVAMTRAEEQLIFTASPAGQGDWVKRISDAFGQPAGVPKQEHVETVYLLKGETVRIIHTGEAIHSDYTPVTPAVPDSVEDLDSPPLPDQHETTLPVTSVAQFSFCPRQYYLARYLRWPAPARKRELEHQPEDGEFTASEFGQLVHGMLSGEPTKDAPAEAATMVEGFHSSELGRRAARADRIEREFDFLIELEGMILRGQIDLWFEENGEAILVDYKSDAVEAGNEHLHALRYGPQLRLYALALERHLGRPPDRAYLWYLRTNRAVAVSLAGEQMERAREQVRSLRSAQSTLEFPLREGSHCLRCSYYHNACPSTFVETLPVLL